MTFSITATPAQYAGANGESPAHVVVDIPTTETITKVTRTDSRGVTELFPDAARAIPNNYPGIGGAVVTRTNAIKNPSFELGVNDWVPTFSAGPLALYSSTVFAGQVGGKLGVATADGSSSVAGMRLYSYSMTPGNWAAFRGFVASDSGTEAILRLYGYGGAGTIAGNSSPAPFYEGKTVNHVVQIPDGVTSGYIEAQMVSKSGFIPTGKRLWVDAVMFGEFSSEAEALEFAGKPYFDGATATAGNLKYRWTGTAHASNSEEYFSGWRVTDDGCPFETVTYTAHTAGGTQSVTVNNARPEMPVLLTTLTGGAEWVIAEQITEYTANRETGHVHHDVGDAYPLVTYGPRKLRTGTVGIYCSSHAEALKVEAVLTDHVALIRQHVPGLDLTVSVTRATLTPYEGQGQRTRWAVSVEYTEVVYTPVKRII